MKQHQSRLASFGSRCSPKKAQIKMFETVGVLIIFFFLLITGSVFYFKIQASSMEKELDKQIQLRSLESAQLATFLPELDCSFATVQKQNCFDKLKLDIFPDITEANKFYYFEMFGYATISVKEVFPGTSFERTIYDKPLEEYSAATKSLIPVLLYDPITKDSAFGVMEVTTYAAR